MQKGRQFKEMRKVLYDMNETFNKEREMIKNNQMLESIILVNKAKIQLRASTTTEYIEEMRTF